MSFTNQYPYSDFHEMNLDWMISKINEIDTTVNNLKTEWLSEAEAYTDKQVAQFQSKLTALEKELDTTVATLNANYATFTSQINAQITLIKADITTFKKLIQDEVNTANQYTNYAIAQNNEYIIDQMSKELAKLKVINYFTGASVTVQAMFDYLCQFHTENSITFTELVNKAKTYTEYAAYNMTYTDLALNGGSIIV